jgi:SOS-response transcriptional repressor LexA|tara:strand:+ start:2401 stop:2661 length:261 start_codon:yes stop_codon:yes gene_type:complete
MTGSKKAYYDKRLGWIMKEGLTPKQKVFYDIIKDFIKMNKFSPSYEELKQLSGLNSKSVVHDYVHRLIARGWIKNGNGRNRSISIV